MTEVEQKAEVVEEELADYDEDEEAPEATPTAGEKKTAGSYVGIHTSAFKDFLLKPEILRAISDCGFEHPSEVQHECIPKAVLGIDILCQAKSGMGKTAVFVLSVLQQLEPEKATNVLVLCHTRELAVQISREFERFSKYLPEIKTAVFYGGVSVQDNVKQLQENVPQIVVGTPGRIRDLISRQALKLDKIKYFVLDECDQMFEKLSMRGEVQEIFQKTPRDKQVMMFSATMAPETRTLCKRFMQEPHEILVDSDKLKLHGLVQHFVKLQESEKNRKLADLLDKLEFNQVIIFVKNNQRAELLRKILEDNKFPAVCIHSSMLQSERIRIYDAFKKFQHRILVATELFGRGIDIERVNIVINYDMPDNANKYLHRVGRAGRFGTKGLAISFVSSEEDNTVLQAIQDKFLVKITELPENVQPSFYM